MLNFYANPISPYAQKTHLFLEEVGRPYQYHLVNLAKGEQLAESFQKVAPLGQVPAIELDGFSMSESNAILRYLAVKWERFDFLPANLEDRAKVDTMMEFTNLHINRFLISMAWNLHWAPRFGLPSNQRVVEESRDSLLKNLVKLEGHLVGRTFLVGSGMTLADVCLLPFAAQYRTAQVTLTDFPNFQNWVNRMTDRPAWKKVMSESEKLLSNLRP